MDNVFGGQIDKFDIISRERHIFSSVYVQHITQFVLVILRSNLKFFDHISSQLRSHLIFALYQRLSVLVLNFIPPVVPREVHKMLEITQ